MTMRAITPEQQAAAQTGRQDARRKRAEAALRTVDALLADAGGPVPDWAQRHAAKARKGNLRSLVALKCGDCSCWRRTEIAACPVTTCPLYPVRPYQSET
jgi:hypothetical protein